MTSRILGAAFALVAMSSAAMAHPGGHLMTLAQGVWHLLTEPDHLALLAGAVGVTVFIFRRARRVA